MSNSQDCIFCKIIAREIPADIVYENDSLIAFPDIHPSAPTHLLLVPRKHTPGFENLTAVDQPILGAIVAAAHQLIDENKLGGQFKIVINGPDYRHVDHLHFHLLGGQLTGPLP